MNRNVSFQISTERPTFNSDPVDAIFSSSLSAIAPYLVGEIGLSFCDDTAA
jgi:hypothetical protein